MAAQFGRRLRRGATTTAVAAVAVAALAASQGPGALLASSGADTGGDQPAAGSTPSDDPAASGNSPYYTDLPPLVSPNKPGTSTNLPITGSGQSGIPASVLAAYKKAERSLADTDASCRLPWQLLAAIGKVESGQARGGRVDANGTTFSPILGPVLNGQGFAMIKDTDNGVYDGDSTHDRAVGPMQFIPSTWATWGQDGNGDGRKDPNNIYDAALAAGHYLCAGSRDLAVAADLDRAVLSYNHSNEYLRTVRSWFDYYRRGTHEIPDGSGVVPPPLGGGTDPSPNPGTSRSPSPSPTPPPSRKPDPEPAKPGGGSKSPVPRPKPTPPQTLGAVENAGTGKLTATAGDAFAERIKVRAKNSLGGPLAKVSVTFTIAGDTDARFEGGKTAVTLATGADGTVTAPVLQAGEKTGRFTVRAIATGRSLPAVPYTATVTARQADAIARTDDKALTAAPGAEFADNVAVKATYRGAVASGVAVTATMITDGGTPVENDKGPYFKDAGGNPVRTLTDLKTGADGTLTLPKIYADDTTGTYRLRLTTEGGATVVIELDVEAPAA
ncbi:lytic transglycosylase domain-containing protein [Streptomyces sp. NPDC005969]|uniref:lytic transglycosylase domain-containing protein n=1 Tax=Streptomyces sp. NPDC005969 TaxID=3156722 RepID=UPI0033DDB996